MKGQARYQIILLGEQRHTGMNNLSKVVARQCSGLESNPRPLDHESDTLTTTPPGRSVSVFGRHLHLSCSFSHIPPDNHWPSLVSCCSCNRLLPHKKRERLAGLKRPHSLSGITAGMPAVIPFREWGCCLIRLLRLLYTASGSRLGCYVWHKTVIINLLRNKCTCRMF